MLTSTADTQPRMNPLHKHTDAQRMVPVRPPQRYPEWLEPTAAVAEFMPVDAEHLRKVVPTPAKAP